MTSLLPLCTVAAFTLGAPHNQSPSTESTPVSTARPNGATAVIDATRSAPMTLELGELLVGQPKTMPFTVVNLRSEPFTVESVKGGCGCTTVTEPPKGPIAPGESFTVQVTVDPGKRGGIDLVKPLYVKYVSGGVESAQIIGRVRPIAAVTPSTLDASDPVAITVESLDGRPFLITGVSPAGTLVLPKEQAPAARIELTLDAEAWIRAGRPASLVIATDLAGTAEVVIPVRGADQVVLFRLPPATGDEAARAEIEENQAAIIRQIDALLPAGSRSSQFRMRLHPESGMLFIHGTESDIREAREAIRGLPESARVRESAALPSP